MSSSPPTVVYPNHYGGSNLRSYLNLAATTTYDYFNTTELSMLQDTTLSLEDTKNGAQYGSLYNITDKLFSLSKYDVDLLMVGGIGAIKFVAREYYWNTGDRFWLCTPYNSQISDGVLYPENYAYCAVPGAGVEKYSVTLDIDVRPAAKLNLSSVLFASAAGAASSATATFGTIVKDGNGEPPAMTLRLDGSSKNIGTVTFNTTKNDIQATKGSTAGAVALVVQGNDGTNDWYYSKQITGTETVNASAIKSALHLSTDIDLSACKIWLETTEDNLKYAVTVKGCSTEEELRSALDEAGVTSITLLNNITLTSTLDLSDKIITLDLAGRVLTGNIKLADSNAAPESILTLIDSDPTKVNTINGKQYKGGVIDGQITLTRESGSVSHLYANGGTVTGQTSLPSYAGGIFCTSDTPTAFKAYVGNYGEIHGGIFYADVNNDCIKEKTVTFMNGSSRYALEVVADGNKVVEPLSPPLKTGYNSFDAWYNGDTKYTFGSSLSEDITLTAKFSNPKAYNISYNLGGGTATNATSYTVESDAITLNNPTKNGYTFTGWSGTGLTGENNMTVTIAKGSTGNRTYTAHYTENSDYIVAFDTVGGSGISDKTGVKWTDTVLSGITAPTKDGWEFTGWKCGDMTVNANTKYSDLVANDTVASVTLVAQWKDTEKPVITGLENGKTYCDAVKFEVSDNDGIASVKAGNTVLTATNGKYTIEKGAGTVTIVATDKAKNETTITVTVNNGHTAGTDDGNCETPVYCIYHPTTVVLAAKSHDFSGEWQSNGNGTHTRYCTISGCNGYEDGNCTGGQASYFKKAVCKTCNKEYGELLTDTTAPNGEITVGTNKWNTFLNTITFGLFFKNTQSVTISATDDSYNHNGYTDDKAVKVEYYLYSGDNALTKADLAGLTFTAYNGTFSINPDNKYVVYVKLTDHAGNVTYISSNGIVLDATAPVITGIENGKVYCEEQTVTVTEEYIESVKVNGTAVTLDANNQFTLNPSEGTQTIVVTDKAGNVSAEMIVTVNDGHTYEWQSENGQYWQKCKYCNDETAKKDIPTFTIDTPDTVCRTQDCEASVTLPDGITDAVLTFEFIGLGGAIDTTVEDGKLYGVVTADGYPDAENSFNFVVYATTDDGFPFTVSKTVQIQNEHAGGVANCIELAICDTCGEHYGEVDSTNHNLEKISAKNATVTETGNTEYWHCLDCGKYFADENGINEITLDDTVIAKLPPEIIEGKEQSITAGEKKELTFKSNAAFSDFIRAQLDGKTLDEKNYTVKEGSTIVTLNADYVATLSAGEHTIGIVSESGTAETTFTVNAKAIVNNDKKSPETGNDGATALWLAFLLSCGGAIVVTGTYSKRKKHSR